MKNLNEYYKQPVVVAAELFSAGWCNLDCQYCYIPKTDFLKKVHKDIIESIASGKYLEQIKQQIGKDLEALSHWGTEPSLTTKYFKNFYKNVKTDFPKLKDIKLSSNFMTPPTNLFEFITEILPTDHKLSVELQVSCDGPEYITDKNRIGGSTKTILNNCLELTKMLNEVDFIHRVQMHLKPTFSSDDIRLASDFKKCEEYYIFFDNFIDEWKTANKNNKVHILTGCDPTIVLPGTYTVQDGKNFYQLYKNQIALQNKKWKHIFPDSNYYHRWKNKLFFYREYFTKQRMFVCSAGDTCIGIGDIKGTIHPCHATFYLDHEEYEKETMKSKINDQAKHCLENGFLKQLKEGFVANENNELQVLRSLYLSRLYNDFIIYKLSTSLAMALELSKCGQISKIYENVKMAEILSYLIQTTECPMDCVLMSGSVSIPTASLLRLFGNGLFEEILKRSLKNLGGVK